MAREVENREPVSFHVLVGHRVWIDDLVDHHYFIHKATESHFYVVESGDSLYVCTYHRSIIVNTNGNIQNDGPLVINWDPEQHRKTKLKKFLDNWRLWNEHLFGCWTFTTS